MSSCGSTSPQSSRPSTALPAPESTLPAPQVVTGAPDIHVDGSELVAGGKRLRLLGVDATGTEDACIQNKGFGWGSMDEAEAKAIASWHANAVRIPLNEDCWLGINGAPARFSGDAYKTRIAAWVSALNHEGIVAILDLHWSAPGDAKADQQWPMPDASHSVTFWSQVAATFRTNPSVIFDLFNEPYLGRSHPTPGDWACWLNGCTTSSSLCASSAAGHCSTVTYPMVGMQKLVDTVRAQGAREPIMVGGLNWAGDPCGIEDEGSQGEGCAWLRFEPSDPLHQLVASFHTYNFTACNTRSCWNQSVAPVAAHVPVVTGELGEKNCSTGYIGRYMNWADAHGISYLAWSWQTPSVGLGAHASSECGSQNTHLLASWDGTASNLAPAGAYFQRHLAEIAHAT